MELCGSQYEGGLRHGRFEGYGRFTFPSGAVYEGGFKDGAFHGSGTLTLKPGGGTYKAQWDKGVEVSGSYTFADGLPHAPGKDGVWTFCTVRDRRFYEEVKEGMDAEVRTPPLPAGAYDVGDGYLRPESGSVHQYESHELLRAASAEEASWALRSCRVGVPLEGATG